MTNSTNNKIRMGMIGGGKGAFIGPIHRIAANIDNDIELICGAFSSTKENSIASGELLRIPSNRCYESYQTMLEQEASLPADQRMQFVVIVTPNHLHFNIAKSALEHGFHVLCDKPATMTLDEAKILKKTVETSGLLYGLTYTYTGYPMVKEAQKIIQQGDIGTLRKVAVEYMQDWLADKQSQDNKQAAWRLDPKRSGISGCMADIGCHAANLVEYITQKKITHLCAELTSFVEARQLDDDGIVLLKMEDNIKGTLQASQVATGEENNLNIRIYGDKGSIEWHQQEPNTLILKIFNKPIQLLRVGAQYLNVHTLANTRTPKGHPEGYLEAFANIYVNFSQAIKEFPSIQDNQKHNYDFPNINDGIRGMALIESFVNSHNTDTKWYCVNDLLADIEQ